MSDRALWRLECENERLRDEIARLRLTDEEREAVEWAATASDREQQVAFEAAGAGYNPEKASVWADNHAARAATLRGLLERLGGGE